jgi:hypothetical protein
VFGDRIIQNIFGHHGHPTSPPDYCGAMRGAIYKNNPHTLLELKEIRKYT